MLNGDFFKKIYEIINYRPFIAILCGWLMTGFGQIYNGQLLKGLLFGIPNTTINFYGHLNEALLYAFLGDIEKSQTILNYQWILFYPAIFDISHWDAYEVSYEIQRKCAPPVSHKLPFILSGMFATVGVIFGSKYFPGPIYLGLGGYLVGGLIGVILIKLGKPS
ncbi:hypothetical protein B4065_1581 [Caldibacillus thermoamylovorans]|uniref:Uncharacterized protein n=1 Tax=Caldibacillus thermoamylovorans TaxID=35841 RepID=A0ABD4A909_9BACI|nr:MULTISPECIES: hypothetical protein [Bacillaceae]KIO68620.1 hypothetical protein B4065_1581 [Caldibacillus thermoamylovorans]KIO70784.1 hypothetical protein B4166_1494 [Caldibacillus thermoamylovorans]KIO73473.1 hypothetical protein B4167_2046 [Caldibacillus thermoamylovorans]MCM3799922.1 hypothetical protein [Caldibacillus thermoamylovorans]MEC5273935.1 hypothetical protein [Caldifermentibacillus hisashii]